MHGTLQMSHTFKLVEEPWKLLSDQDTLDARRASLARSMDWLGAPSVECQTDALGALGAFESSYGLETWQVR